MIVPAAPIKLPAINGLPGVGERGISIGDLIGPPKKGSLADRADVLAVRAMQRVRTASGDEWALRMAKDGVGKLWNGFAREYRKDVGAVQGRLGVALLKSTMLAAMTTSFVGKTRYKRERPYERINGIVPPLGTENPRGSSYPSGHAATAFAAARVIATLSPKQAKAAYKLAAQVATSRVYAGVHFPSDVVAGALLGVGVAETALRTAGLLLPK